MLKSATIRARVRPDLKDKAEEIFGMLGMNASEAINLFYSQVILQKGLPFNVSLPSETSKAINEARAGKGKRFASLEALLTDLNK